MKQRGQALYEYALVIGIVAGASLLWEGGLQTVATHEYASAAHNMETEQETNAALPPRNAPCDSISAGMFTHTCGQYHATYAPSIDACHPYPGFAQSTCFFSNGQPAVTFPGNSGCASNSGPQPRDNSGGGNGGGNGGQCSPTS
jgi:hypothetical protein